MNRRRALPVALSIGGNQGDSAAIFAHAVNELARAGLESIQSSSVYRTPPVGCPPGTPDFQNAALTGEWSRSLFKLFNLCKRLEIDAGRPRTHPRYASRPLDLDIVLFGDLVFDDDTLTIPHPESKNRLFVLLPLAEIAGDWRFPDYGESVAETLETLNGTEEFDELMKLNEKRETFT